MANAKARPRGSGFLKGLKAAVVGLDQPVAAVIAATTVRAEFIRGLCVQAGFQREGVRMFLPDDAAVALDRTGFPVVILDPSVEELTRSAFRVVARTRLSTCKVIEVKKWSSDPPL